MQIRILFCAMAARDEFVDGIAGLQALIIKGKSYFEKNVDEAFALVRRIGNGQ